MPNEDRTIPYDMAFLLRAANYEGGADAPHSPKAREAIEAIAERMRVASEHQLAVTREKVKLADAQRTARQELGLKTPPFSEPAAPEAPRT